ncbi:MAG: hypothetical protein K9L85_03795 [Candidatus Peribacteraceae bacterium]|nr:hypothetical protein [Candidatus Peribacteraceae bacterium]
MKTSLAENVWQTLCWFDIFGQAASLEEVHRFLFWQRANPKEIEQVLKKDRRIGSSFGFYFLRGKNASVVKRCGYQFQAGKLWRRVARHLFVLRLVPFLRFVAVGNTLAMGWPERNSDIDLLVVAPKNRLFTARFFLTFWAQIFRMRRHGKKISGRFCLSFFLADNALDLEKLKIGPYDPYLAFWAATLVPIRGDSAEFFAANTWIQKVFPNLKLPTTARRIHKKSFGEKILSGRLGDLLEKLLRKWQLQRAGQKRKNTSKTAVVISDEVLKFHETDQRRHLLQEWQNRINGKSAAKQ